MKKLRTFGRVLPPAQFVSAAPDWQQARVGWIENALRHARSQPNTGWVVVDATREIGAVPRRYRLDGRDYVAWRTPRGPRVAPDACPHMGASLSDARTCDGDLVCAWHGLRLGLEGHGTWKPLPTFDDGVLLWTAISSSHWADGPLVPPRPERWLDAVMRTEARCDPEDIIANRLDPWHGAHYHPYSFARLNVIEQHEDSIVVRVVYRVFASYGIEVDARFHCPERNTIVMTIVRGEGEGSVVETHATPVESGRTAVVEATLATSDRPQFWALVKRFSRFLRPLVRKSAHRLWRDDAAYAERRYVLRTAQSDRRRTELSASIE